MGVVSFDQALRHFIVALREEIGDEASDKVKDIWNNQISPLLSDIIVEADRDQTDALVKAFKGELSKDEINEYLETFDILENILPRLLKITEDSDYLSREEVMKRLEELTNKPLWSQVLYSRYKTHGSIGRFFEVAKITGYPYFEWNGRIYKVLDDKKFEDTGWTEYDVVPGGAK